MASYTVKKISSKKWDVLRDGAAWVPGFPVLGLANLTRDKFNEVDGVKPVPVPEPPPPPPPPPPPVPAMFDATLFAKIIGSTMNPEAIAAIGPTEATYVAKFREWWEKHWAQYGYGEFPGDWTSVNYYDRANMGYAWWAMSGFADNTFRDRARQIADYYFKVFVDRAANGGVGFYHVPPYNLMMKGLALRYAEGGNEQIRTDLGKVADTNHALYGKRIGDSVTGYDNRTAARTHEMYVLAALLNLPSVGVPGYFAGGNDWAALARSSLTQLLSRRDTDLIWRYGGAPNVVNGVTYAGAENMMAKPFQLGMMADAFILHHDAFEPDPRILTAVKAIDDWLFNGASKHTGQPMWDAQNKAFSYLEGPSPEMPTGPWTGPGTGAVNNNGLNINASAFVYKHTRDPLYKERAQRVLEGLVNAWLQGQKQFNQAFTVSYKTPPMLTA